MAVTSVLGTSALIPAGLGMRNTIINGGFAVDQRNAGASQTITAAAALAYTADRWYAYCTGANVTGQRVAGSAPLQYNYKFTGATSNTAIGFGQRIEAANSFHYAGTTATLSAYIASSSLTSITWTLYYATTADSFGTVASPTRTQIATGTFTISSTLTRYSVQIPVPAAATTGLELVFTTGALTATNTLTFGGVQLEANYQLTPFEQRPVGLELALCQRYYYKILLDATNRAFSLGWADSTTVFVGTIPFPQIMRIRPTALETTGTAGDYMAIGPGVSATATSVPSYDGTTGNFQGTIVLTASGGGLTTGRCGQLRSNTSGTSFYAWSAEL